MSKHIGSEDEDNSDKRILRYYFDPKQFGAPNDPREGGSTKQFSRLKRYILMASEKCGSPVMCVHGDSGKWKCHK